MSHGVVMTFADLLWNRVASYQFLLGRGELPVWARRAESMHFRLGGRGVAAEHGLDLPTSKPFKRKKLCVCGTGRWSLHAWTGEDRAFPCQAISCLHC